MRSKGPMTAGHAESFWAEHFGLHGRVALVTGASGGIGAALARGLAAAGAAVMLAGRDASRLEALQAEIAGAGGRSAVVVADLAGLTACGAVAAATIEALGGLHILVNCAGMNRR